MHEEISGDSIIVVLKKTWNLGCISPLYVLMRILDKTFCSESMVTGLLAATHLKCLLTSPVLVKHVRRSKAEI